VTVSWYREARGATSSFNSTTTPLLAAAPYTGDWEINDFDQVMVTCLADVDGTLYVDFSENGADVTETREYDVDGGLAERHVLEKGRRYFRVRYVNDSVNQTSFILTCYFGSFGSLSVPANTPVRQDADTTVVRVIPSDIELVSGRLQGFYATNKYGRNLDIDTATVPEDVWNGGGVYTGFPVGAAAACSVVSTNAGDTGTITIEGLATETSIEYTSANYTLNGTTPVSIGSWWRINRAFYNNGTASTFNLGDISIYRTATPANIFVVIATGVSQTSVAAYTIPFGHKGYLKKLYCEVSKNSPTSVVDGGLWIREYGKSPRLTRLFTASSSASQHLFEPNTAVELEPRTDIAMRITACSANNTIVFAGFDIVYVRDIF
jgi:hypothetical protein